MRRVRLVGIDCATVASEVGVAAGVADERGVRIDAAERGATRGSLAGLAPRIEELLGAADLAILALDAPLGWPVALAGALPGHQAGEQLGEGGAPGPYFHRLTDEVAASHQGGRAPLEVGANFIARTAFAALELLHALRARRPGLPLLWVPGWPAGVGAIEVYPAATLRARGLSTRGYKPGKAEERAPARRALLDELRAEVTFTTAHAAAMVASDHVLDAVLCVLAAKDFLDGLVVPPEHAQALIALKEGWIWFRRTRGA